MGADLTFEPLLQYKPLVYPPQEITVSPQTMELMQRVGEQEAKKAAARRQAAIERLAAANAASNNNPDTKAPAQQ